MSDETERILPSDDSSQRSLAPGRQIFGRYRLEAIAGRGGMGVVWRARDEELDRTVALKFLPDTVASDPEAVRDLKRETKRCLELTHPNIVRVYDFVQDATGAAIAMEFVDGESLAKRKAEAANGCLSTAEVMPLIAQLCPALDYAHAKAKVVHRDLKPANLLLTRDGELKITDFGIARSLTESRTRLTGQSSGTSGTLPFMSPQQLAGDKPDASDDIYALGATLYDLLTGKPPFYRGDAFTLMKQIAERAPMPLAEHRAEAGFEGPPIPATWSETVLACIEKLPARRPRTAGEVARRLGVVTEAEPASPPTSDATVVAAAAPSARTRLAQPSIPLPPAVATREPVASSPSAPSWRSKLPLLATALGIVVLALGYYFGLYRPEQQRVTTEKARLALEQAQVAELKRAADEKRAADDRERQRLERQSFTTITARIDGLANGTPRNERDTVERAVTDYLTAAPANYRPDVEKRWLDRAAAWEAARLAARGGLIVNTTPPGADIMVSAIAAEKSPATLRELKLGKYPVTIRLAGYDEERREIEIKENEFASVDVTLARSTGAMQVVSNPPGLNFVLEGEEQTERGRTPARFPRLPTGTYTLTVSRPGWPDIRQSVTVARGQTTSPVAEFASGDLEIASEPAGAEVWIEGQRVGRTPMQLRDLKPSRREVELRLSGYKNAVATGDVRAHEAARVNVTLEKLSGPLIGKAWTVPDLALGMIWVRPGTFAMGTPQFQAPNRNAAAANNANDPGAAAAALVGSIVGLAQSVKAIAHANESPQTTVQLTTSYWLGKTEVTREQFEQVMGAPPGQLRVGRNLPVESVTWDEAMEFCRRLTQREREAGRLPEGWVYTLPSEAQWEYACRGGTRGQHAGSLDLMAWFDQNSGNAPHAVGQKQPNAWGFYDMHGNVAEWCLDAFGTYPGGTVTNYVGSGSGAARPVRGGAWKSDGENCSSASRLRERSNVRSGEIGFRLALVPND
jgi:serine/threonine protein kinase/formylglycine-generating enzyme required for sulfatase activity